MSGDYSRVRFDPSLDIGHVLMQQGRVQLDSDWNEWAAALDRRFRAESIDTFGVQPKPGITGVAVVSPQTPDAFKIEAAGGTITIGLGRMYVDGLLAENHGGGTPEFDPVLAELRGQAGLAYGLQPYFPAPPALPESGTHLAYLEVWQRELTHLERPELVEIAVGVDTTARWQTAWQVRLLDEIGGADCTTPDDEFPAWQALIRPSAGRLSSKAEGVPPEEDPCELPPTGGYRGLENQLYRIEIHDGGGADEATFKWSRDNASVASSVVEIVSHTGTSTELKLASLGRDAVLRFHTGDWVEILDDRRELSGEGGSPALRRGVMRKIDVHDDKQTIEFSPALPADLIPAGGDDTLAARHTRVKRWNQKDGVGTNGVIPVSPLGAWITLENGVKVRFALDPAGGEFRCGDYWVTAARTNGTSVESFTDAPPRGIHRHYARLAIVTFPDKADSCRVQWPPACGGCCTVTVAPGESIQAAIDSLPPEGGCVCLKTGVHEIRASVKIRAPNIILRGESPGTIVRSPESTLLLIVPGETAVSDVAVESIRFEATEVAEGDDAAILYAFGCSRLRVQDCAMVATPEKPGDPIGALLLEGAEVTFVRNRLQNVRYGVVVADYAGQVEVSHNHIEGAKAEGLGAGGSYGVSVSDTDDAACHIRRNFIAQFLTGIRLAADADGALAADNRISRSAAVLEDTLPVGSESLRNYLDKRLYAIDVESPNCEVRGNHINLPSPAFGGIRASAAHAKVIGNTLEAKPGEPGSLTPLPAGIYCCSHEKEGRAADHAMVLDNRLLGPQSGVVVSRIDGAMVAANHIDGGGSGWYGTLVDDCRDGCVRDNDIEQVWFGVQLSEGERNRLDGNQIRQTLLGIGALQEVDLVVSGNTLLGCVMGGVALVWVMRSTAVLGNRIMNCGYAGNLNFGMLALGQELLQPSGAMLRVQDCEIVDSGVSPDGKQASSVAVTGISAWVPACQITANHIGTQAEKLNADLQHRALLLIGPIGIRFVTGAAAVESMLGGALVSANQIRGPGRSALVEFLQLPVNDNISFRFEKVTFSNNQCEHLGAEASDQAATVSLAGGKLIAMGNHVKADPNVNAMSLANGKKTVLMGNVTTGSYIRQGTVTPSPIPSFNVIG
jgi:nitrous oxidase accessory protein NosD